MDVEKEAHLTDEEEDLEALRLAALQSLKKKNAVSNGHLDTIVSNFPTRNEQDQTSRQGRPHKGFVGKKGRYFGGRGSRNGQFHMGRLRSTNLISITPIADGDEIQTGESNRESTFTHPQNKYTITENDKTNKSDETLSKFDRYNDSDKSEEESEDDSPKSNSDNNSTPKLERSDSLEALMKELDNEIQGKTKSKEKDEKIQKTKPKGKKVKESTKVENETDISHNVETNSQSKEATQIEDIKTEGKGDSSMVVVISEKKPEETEPQIKKRKLPFPPRREFHGFRRNRQHPSPPYQKPAFMPNMAPMPFPPGVPPMFPPTYGPPNIMIPPPPIPFFERPLSPLLINAETLQTQTMAPLSPRSAAFVLENRAIIEKRKRSPRRSYSRSPSPRRRSPSVLRRSLSPRRRSPKRRSNSPRRRSTSPRARQYSPKSRPLSPKLKAVSPHSPKARVSSPKQRPFSPKQRTFSPNRRSVSPKRTDKKEPDSSPKNKPSIRERLGFKGTPKSENKEAAENPEQTQKPEERHLDPVLEARKRKFETKEIQVKEGVIRLKPKDESKPEKIEDTADTNKEIIPEPVQKANNEKLMDVDVLFADDEIELESKINLFSDEESGSENEGRFKAKEQITNKPSVLSFAKLINGTKEKVELAVTASSKRKRLTDKPVSKTRASSQRSIKSVESSKESKKPRSVRSLPSVKADRREIPKKFDRKIEIKLKNPSKYDKEEKSKREKRTDEKKDRDGRKIDVENTKSDGIKIVDGDDDFETEIVIENDGEEEIENSTNDEDLRTQLSKKRAEKLTKNSSNETVPSRLLQNALQNALPIKKTKKSKSEELSNTDGKVPIHMRLGTCSSEVFNKPKRKSRKRKNVESEGQV